MSTRGLGFIDTLSFDGTNYDAWKICMLNYFRGFDPCMERIVDMGFSPPKDTHLSLEDEKNSYLNAQASNVLVDALSNVDIFQLMPFRDAHELWTKLQDKYGASKIRGDDCSPSTSARDAFSTSSTSPTCGFPQEENQQSMEQDVVSNGASRDPTSSSRVTHFCLMAKELKVTPTFTHISSDGDDVDNVIIDNVEEDDNIASLNIKGEMIFKALHKNKIACSNFMEIMSIAIEGKKYIEEFETHIEENEATIEKIESHERDYANEIAELSQALEFEQTTKESLEETFVLELSKVKGSLDITVEVANSIKTKHDKLVVVHATLLEDFEHLKNGSRVIKGELIKL